MSGVVDEGSALDNVVPQLRNGGIQQATLVLGELAKRQDPGDTVGLLCGRRGGGYWMKNTTSQLIKWRINKIR